MPLKPNSTQRFRNQEAIWRREQKRSDPNPQRIPKDSQPKRRKKIIGGYRLLRQIQIQI